MENTFANIPTKEVTTSPRSDMKECRYTDKRGRLRREDGPALTHTHTINGTAILTVWYRNDYNHRIDGPAYISGRTLFFTVNGKDLCSLMFYTDGVDISTLSIFLK
jgi:hypothetical protein